MAAVSPSVLTRWAAVAAYMAVIFFISGWENATIPAGTTDFSWHTLGYLGLAVLVCRALAGGFGKRIGLRVALAAVAISTVYGVTDEWHQTFVAGRSGDVNDLAADAIGACAGAMVSWAWGIIAPTIRPASGASR